MNTYVKLTGASSGRPIYLDTDYIAGFSYNVEDKCTSVGLRVRDNEVYYVRETPDEVAEAIEAAELKHFRPRAAAGVGFMPPTITPIREGR